MLRQRFQRAILASLVLSLAACGGDDDGALTSETMDPMDQPPPRVDAWIDAATTRTLTGGQDPDFSDTDVPAMLDQLISSSDSLLASDLLATLPIGAPVTLPISCMGATCSVPSQAGAVLGLTDLSLSVSDLRYTDAEAGYQALASHRGASIAQGSGPTTIFGVTVERYGYGGWMDHSFFAVESGVVTDGPAIIQDAEVFFGYSVGDAADTNPMTGSATWTGVMVGMDSGAQGAPVQGDAEVSIDDFMNPMVDVAFTNVRNLVAETTYANLSWTDMALTEGSFGDPMQGKSIAGRFYGPGHEEVGGTFQHGEILGAFGANR